MDITVSDKFIRVSPRKARPVLFGLRGEKVLSSLERIGFIRKKASLPISKLIKSGVAAAKESGLLPDNLYVKAIMCNEGPRLRRRRFESKGRSARITKRMSHLVLTLSDEMQSIKSKKTNTKSQINFKNQAPKEVAN
ncbi:MAG: 50S ribosomal protein L22 [Patescibacteria group bacterium]